MAVSEAIENYLETIYILSLRQNEVHAIDICSYLSYSRPTVSIVLRQMRENGLVTVNDDNHIFLTDEGRAIAARIYERHTVLTSLLVSLGVNRETAQRDACKIEHDLSDETFAAIKRHARAHGRDTGEAKCADGACFCASSSSEKARISLAFFLSARFCTRPLPSIALNPPSCRRRPDAGCPDTSAPVASAGSPCA